MNFEKLDFDVEKLKIEKIPKEKWEKIYNLEMTAMNTDTTYPWKKEELVEVFEKGE